MFSDKDLQQIKERGMEVGDVEKQIRNFEEGFPYLQITKAATPGAGIIQYDEDKIEGFVDSYEEKSSEITPLKFVPASGAASRMFKALFSFMKEYEGTEKQYQELTKDQGFQSVFNFIKRIDDFAFYPDLKEAYKKKYNLEIEEALLKRKYKEILEALLTEAGLNYGSLPKGLLKFHAYPSGSRTPVEEHLVEGANYAKSGDNVVRLHFTVSPEHKQSFLEHIEKVVPNYESTCSVSFDISFSEQKPYTDTVAVDMQNQPFRNSDGTILFRPGGHGALIENLLDQDADIIFIKNIDNVVPDKLKQPTFKYKKALGGILLHFQDRIFNYLEKLEENEVEDSLVAEVDAFLKHEMYVHPKKEFDTKESHIEYLKKKLNRPLRVCGMVKNEGEPGGGPYWATNPDGSESLQIVESSQVEMDNKEQVNIFKNATHFNPVDIVVATKDYKGNNFDLLKFRDPATGFISHKSKDGKELKAQELPGLWNGAMADWNTIFVEVPIVTFNPVKTVNDLLRDQHQQ